MAFAKLQQEQGNNKLVSGGGMTGTATPGQSGGNKSQAGTPGGFTNIQDYMNANKGDTTNQNYLNNKTDSQIGNSVNQMNSNISNLSAINQNPTASSGELNSLLQNDDYTKANSYANPTFKATNEELPSLNDPTSKITGDLSGVMSYIGKIKEPSQSYTGGMQKFDEMLLSGDKEFPGQFAANKQADYKSKVLDPYGAATAARDSQKATEIEKGKGWQNQLGTYMKDVNKQAQDKLGEQQAQYNAMQNKVKSDPDLYDQLYGTGALGALQNRFTAAGLKYDGRSNFNGDQLFKDYFNVQGAIKPTFNSAVNSLDSETVKDYNGLQSQLPSGSGYGALPLSDAQFNAGKIGFNQDDFLKSLSRHVTKPVYDRRENFSTDELEEFFAPQPVPYGRMMI